MKSLTTAYIAQAKKNFEFVKSVHGNHPDDFFDWKVIIVFYSIIHGMKALLYEAHGIETQNHVEIDGFLKSKIPEHLWKNYRDIRVFSETCRYEGIQDATVWNDLHRGNFKRVLSNTRNLVAYLTKRKITLGFTAEDIDKLMIANTRQS